MVNLNHIKKRIKGLSIEFTKKNYKTLLKQRNILEKEVIKDLSDPKNLVKAEKQLKKWIDQDFHPLF